MTIYRLNRVPDKLHVTLLELLGIQLDGPSAAAHRRALPARRAADQPLLIPGGATEVGTPRTARDESIVFQVDEDFTIPAAAARRLRAPARRPGQGRRRRRRRGPAPGRRPARVRQPARGRRRAVPRLRGAARPARARRSTSTPRRPAAPASAPRTRRCAGRSPRATTRGLEATVLEDLTGGFNYGAGTVDLQLPPRSAVQPLGGHRMHWLRCRIDDKTRHGGAATTYTQAPEIYSITAAPIGALLPTSHAAQEENEILGVSDGTPGQTFPLRYSPVLKPGTGETLEVQDPESGDWAAWELRQDFVVLDRVRPPLHRSTRCRARSSSAPRSARPTAAGPSTARSRRRARCCASPATATAAGAPATSRPTR